ncbi:anti-anti-sigma factor [Nocardia tenerifensis]|uniref:Anti-sigma factor antagonist n=2 Tax=Nocardia tenerifensis TaxID=228006 RepID=A0A318KA28_9NOCA|nr:STAS domain-containing protein [Nocardia tenerifensis]PXX71178.1 anti-anti-sigma factor [Nocardia tenerifensis]
MIDEFSTSTRPITNGVVLRFVGGLDATAAPAARAAIENLVLRPGERLVVDLSGLLFCDSSGISMLLAARNAAALAQADIALAAVPSYVLRTLALIGLHGVFATYPTLDDAAEPTT